MAESWRSADLRGDDGPPRSVAGVVRLARRALVATRWAEALLLAGAALCLVLAAAAWSGTELARADAWAAAVLGGAACAASWMLVHRASAPEVARALDRALRHQGALVTAYEVELRRARGPLERLCVERVLARLRGRDALRAVRPPLAVPVAAPLIGAAVLALALDLVRSQPEPRPLGEVTAALADRLARAPAGAVEAAEVDPALARELRALAVDARALDLAAAKPGSREEARRRAEDLDARLARLGRERAEVPALRRELGAARSWLDVLRGELGAEEAPASPPAPAAGDPGAAGGPGAPGDADGGSGVTGERGDGIMSGSTAGGADPSSSETVERPPDPSAGASETGVAAGAWWPAEHDELVRRWLERVRRGDRSRTR